MPFTFQTSGMDELIQQLDKLEEKAQKIASEALYEGAGAAADAVSQAVHGITTQKFRYANGWQRDPSPEEKEILENARMGIAKFRKTPLEVNTSVGFQNSGYAELKGKRVPVAKIANAINSGTSFLKKQPFFRKATGKNKAAQAAIEEGLRKRLNELSLD